MSRVEIRVDGSYVYVHPASHVPRTVQVRSDLLVDLREDGRIAGVERLGAAVTTEDLASVLYALPFDGLKPPPADKSWVEMEIVSTAWWPLWLGFAAVAALLVAGVWVVL